MRPMSAKPEERVLSPAAPSPPRAATTATSAGGSYSQFRSADERAAYIKEKAAKKMAERMAALGLRPPPGVSTAETTEQRLQREKKEQEERRQKAEAEEAQREKQRQQRLEADGFAPPSSASPTASKKAPPPPAPRKDVQDKARADEEIQKRATEGQIRAQQEALRQEQEAEEARRNAIE